jgi:amidase
MRWFDHARRTARGSLPDGGFRGVPFLLKDSIAAYAQQPLANANVRLKEAAVPSPADTSLVSRFRAAGLVIAGRTNTPEFADQATTEPRAWGATRNPWSLAHSPGGSSGGAAAAVASGMVPFAHATDGAGSIRIPASCCGVVGLKPRRGRITAGPFGDESGPGVELCVSRSVRDTAALLDAVHGPSVGDAVIAPAPNQPYVSALSADPKLLRVGLLDRLPGGERVHPDCAHAAGEAARLLEELGHRIDPAAPAALSDPGISRHVRLLSSASTGVLVAILAQALGREVTSDDVEAVTWARAQQSRSASAADYAQAARACSRFGREVQGWWAEGFDLLLTPTCGEPPARLGAFATDPSNPLASGPLSARYTGFAQPFNIAGQPAMSLPLHWNAEGLPIGVQLVAAYGREDILIAVAAQLERARPWAHRRPPLAH